MEGYLNLFWKWKTTCIYFVNGRLLNFFSMEDEFKFFGKSKATSQWTVSLLSWLASLAWPELGTVQPQFFFKFILRQLPTFIRSGVSNGSEILQGMWGKKKKNGLKCLNVMKIYTLNYIYPHTEWSGKHVQTREQGPPFFPRNFKTLHIVLSDKNTVSCFHLF